MPTPIKRFTYNNNGELCETFFVSKADDKGNVDMNTITATGFYRVAGGSQSANHYPASGTTAWNLAVFQGGANSVIQIAKYYSNSHPAIYIRSAYSNSSAFSYENAAGTLTWPSASPYGWTELGASGSASLNRTITINDNSASTTVSDTGGDFTIPLAVTVAATSASNTQNTTTSAQSLRTLLKSFRDNIAHLFTNKIDTLTAGTNVTITGSGTSRTINASGGGSSIPNPLPTDMGGTGSQNINQAAYNLFQTSQPNSINYVYGEGGNGAGYRQTTTFFGDILEQTYQTGTFIASTNSKVSSVSSGVLVKYASNKVDMHGIVNCSGYVSVAGPWGANSGILLFTLPTGFRPKTTRRFSGTTTPFYGGSIDFICNGWNGIINTNGNVNLDWAPEQAYNQSVTFFFDFTFMGPIQ